MSSTPSARSEPPAPAGRSLPDWLWTWLGVDGPWQGTRSIGGQDFEMRGGIPRSAALLSAAQAQTEETFGCLALFGQITAREVVSRHLFENRVLVVLVEEVCG